jgi:hypothetical protein
MASLAKDVIFGHWRVLEIGCLFPDHGTPKGSGSGLQKTVEAAGAATSNPWQACG